MDNNNKDQKDEQNIVVDDDILTSEEEAKILTLHSNKPHIDKSLEIKLHKVEDTNIFGLGGLAKLGALAGAALGVSHPLADFALDRRTGINPWVTINNISGKKSWVILSPAPITGISSVGVEKIGQVSFSSVGDYKCQQYSLANDSTHDFELDNSQIYYTVFFDCDGKWKTPFKNRRINTRKYNINLLERHVNDSIEVDFVPVI